MKKAPNFVLGRSYPSLPAASLDDLFDQPIKAGMNTLALLNGLRFVDSFFPSGGFAFSSGLEAAVKDGALRDGKDLARYVGDLLVHGIGRREAVAVAVAHQAAATCRVASPSR